MKIKSIRSKVLVSIIGITLLTSIALGVVFYEKSAQLIEENYVMVLEQRIRLMTDTMDDMLKNVCNITIKASSDEGIKTLLTEYLKSNDEEKLGELSTKMRIFAKQDNAITSIYMMIPKKNCVVTTLDYPVYKKNISLEKIQSLQKNMQKNTGPLITEDVVHDGKKVLQFSEPVTDTKGKTTGYLCVNIEESNLRYNYLEDMTKTELDQLYFMNNRQIIASGFREVSQMGKVFDKKVYDKWMDHSMVEGKDKNNIYIYCQGAFSGCGIFASAKKSVVLGNLLKMKKYIFEITAIVLIIAFFAAIYITHIVYKPIKKLKRAMQKVAEGEMQTRAEIVSNDEIGMAAREFNQMLDQIEKLIQQLINKEKQKKDAELEALQYQITPHFMYNTLNSIKCYALIHQQAEIAQTIEEFVELLQTCIRKKGAFLTVAEEVHILENYIHLQEFRNGEKYQVNYNIHEEAQQCMIPRLLLQPLIENAILHGIDIKKGQGQINIGAWIEGQRLYLKVQDNGRGMSEEQIKELLGKKEKKTKGLTAVGIPNIRERLRLYYGEQAELSFDSSDEGTTVIIYLPV